MEVSAEWVLGAAMAMIGAILGLAIRMLLGRVERTAGHIEKLFAADTAMSVSLAVIEARVSNGLSVDVKDIKATVMRLEAELNKVIHDFDRRIVRCELAEPKEHVDVNRN